jgi:hypothetical protein
MWRRLARPQVLIVLDASLPTIRRRRKMGFGGKYLEIERRRLGHARSRSDLVVDTDLLTEDQVLDVVLSELGRLGVRPRRA